MGYPAKNILMRELAEAAAPEFSLYQPGQNCWRVERADFAAPIVDCANYYRALHEAICNATRSVFVLGWDIDSRIELLRGREADAHQAPSRFFDLVKWKARQNPEVEFYLNRWDYTLYQAGEREGFSLLRWHLFVPGNVHYHLDNAHPVGGCHHQKIVVIDDELAFVGGMDVAIGRWDYRSHHPKNNRRVDPGGTYEPRTRHAFPPHHDLMIVVAGPVAGALGHVARQRWRVATGSEPPAARKTSDTRKNTEKPRSWPGSLEPHFTGIPVVIARTMPPYRGEAGIREIERLYIDQIAEAERFIYMENQYLTSREIAVAINRQLLARPDLRTVLISCCDPQGIMERKAMWGGRVLFKDLLIKNGAGDRVLMAYPFSRENAREEPIRVHSKLMVVDDRFLHVGSSNLNNRSLRLDTECDLSIEGQTPEVRRQIAALRNDMLREHTGWPLEQIEQFVSGSDNPEKLLVYRSESRQHLRKIDDEKYRYQRFMRLAIRLADPEEPFFRRDRAPRKPQKENAGPRRFLILLLALAIIAGIAVAWKTTPLAAYSSPSHIAPFFIHIRHNPWAFPAIIGIYILATMFFFPLNILVFATAIAFSPPKALALAFAGMICSAFCGYTLGRLTGTRPLRFLTGRTAEKISRYTKNGGVMGVTILRLMPLAPFGIVDFGLGMTKVPFPTYVTGTVLGLAPGLLAFTLLGHSIGRLWHVSSDKNLLYLAAGIAGWLAVVAVSHFCVKYWRQKAAQQQA